MLTVLSKEEESVYGFLWAETNLRQMLRLPVNYRSLKGNNLLPSQLKHSRHGG